MAELKKQDLSIELPDDIAIILTPEHAKRLLYSLQDNITRYENAIGKIEIPGAHAADDQTVVNIGPKVGKA